MPSDLFNNEAEQFMLAAILRNPTEYFSVNDMGLVASDFANRDHIYIFRAITSAVESKDDPTLPYVIEYLKRAGKDHVVDYVGSLMTTPCSIAEAHGYAKVVKGLSVSRNLGNAGVKIIDIAQEKRGDYNSAIVEAENALRVVSDSLPQQERSPSASEILKRMDIMTHDEKVEISFSTTLQSMTGGLSRGHFWVIGAFSSTGKSAFVSNMAIDALRHKKKVAIVSAEMTQEQYLIRLLAIESGISQMELSSKVTIGIPKNQQLLDARRAIEGYELYVYDNLYKMTQIRTELQRLKNQKGLDVLIIDYIQNITVTGDEVSDAREVALECQRLAKDLDCAVIACSQLSNAQAQYEIAGGDENFYSLKGHGAIRDAADVIITLHRDRVRQSSALKVKFRKNRHGPVSDFMCHFDLATSRIEEIAWDDGEE
jgi:replicative DNA helicase